MNFINYKFTEKLFWGSVIGSLFNESFRFIFAIIILVIGINEFLMNVLVSLSYKNSSLKKFSDKYQLPDILIVKNGEYKEIRIVLLIIVWLCIIYLLFSNREFFLQIILIIVVSLLVRGIIAILAFKEKA